MSRPFGPSASRSASRQLASSASLLLKKRPDEALKSLHKCRVRDVALVLVELARRKKAARRNQHLVQFVDDRGLADAGISGDQHQLRHAGLDDAIEAGKQGRRSRALVRTAFSGISSRFGVSLFAEREVIDAAARFPFRQAASQIALDTAGGLVTILGCLGEQFHDDRRDGRWDTL